MLAPITSVKHFVQRSALTVATGVANSFVIVDALAKGTAVATTADVEEGSVVKAVFLEMWAKMSAAGQTYTAVVVKQPGGIASPTATEMSNLASYANKKNILATHQGLAPADGNVIPFFREWIKIPKGKQRFGLGDKLQMRVLSVGGNLVICGISIYKEYV